VPDKNAERQKRKHYGIINVSLKTPKERSGGLEVEQTSRGTGRGGDKAVAGGVIVAEATCCIRSCTASNVLNDSCFSPFLISHDISIENVERV
jgi:hypothetical protein